MGLLRRGGPAEVLCRSVAAGGAGGQGGGQAGQALLGSLQLQAVHRCVRAVGGVLGPLCLDAFVPCLAKGAEGGGLGC